MDTPTEIQEIDIPPNALTTCPDRSYRLVSIASVCQRCPQSLGLFDVMAADAPFAEKYRVRCGVPQAREVVMAEMGGAE